MKDSKLIFMRSEVFRALKAEPEWLDKVKACENMDELAKVLLDFGRAKGLKVAEVPFK
jgi:hypothetical protein